MIYELHRIFGKWSWGLPLQTSKSKKEISRFNVKARKTSRRIEKKGRLAARQK